MTSLRKWEDQIMLDESTTLAALGGNRARVYAARICSSTVVRWRTEPRNLDGSDGIIVRPTSTDQIIHEPLIHIVCYLILKCQCFKFIHLGKPDDHLKLPMRTPMSNSWMIFLKVNGTFVSTQRYFRGFHAKWNYRKRWKPVSIVLVSHLARNSSWPALASAVAYALIWRLSLLPLLPDRIGYIQKKLYKT